MMEKTKTKYNFIKDTSFVKNIMKAETVNYDGKDMLKEQYKLIVTKRDIGLWAIGIEPGRGWKASDVKKYYGLKGKGMILYDNFMELYNEFNEFMKK